MSKLAAKKTETYFKRWAVGGSHPLEGGWGGYGEEFDTRREAIQLGLRMIKGGYSATLIDQKLNLSWDLGAIYEQMRRDWTVGKAGKR